MNRKYVIFENRSETRPGASVAEMQEALIVGDPREVARLDSREGAAAYLALHPGEFYEFASFSGVRFVAVKGCYAVECIVDESGEIVDELDMEFAELKGGEKNEENY